MTIYVVEFAVGELRTTDYDLARSANREHPGSSMYQEDQI